MAYINIINASVAFTVYNSCSRSLKRDIIRVATGGRLASSDGKVVINALENIDCKFYDGDRVGLIGHNGAGKSTLLRLINGVYSPVTGEIKIAGNVRSLIDISLGIDAEATGRENIFIRGALLGMSRAEIATHLSDIVDFSELGDFIDLPMRTYSSGMQLRLAFAVSTILQPDILLMDEWLSVGDEYFKKKVAVRMSEMVGSTKILIIASHSRQLIFKHCNRVLLIEHGRIVADGSPEEVATPYFNGK